MKPWAELFRLEAKNSIVSSPDTNDLSAPQTRYGLQSKYCPTVVLGAYLEVEEERFNSNEMRRLYDSRISACARAEV